MPILDRAGDRLDLMRQARTVAILGMSTNPARASHFVATYLLGRTEWTVRFVNPKGGRVLGQPIHRSLDELPEPPDIVDVFRRADDLPSVVETAIGAGAGSVWFQLGLRHDEAAATAAGAGLDVVQDRCLKIEHARFAGGLHTAGFVTGVIDSRRRDLI